MSKDLFDMKRLPVDRVAARVVGKGVDWTPNKVIQTGDSDLPLPVFPAYNIKNPQQRREVQAMIGRKRGRLTIIGLAVTQGAKNKGARYVARCVCGFIRIAEQKISRITLMSLTDASAAENCCFSKGKKLNAERENGLTGKS